MSSQFYSLEMILQDALLYEAADRGSRFSLGVCSSIVGLRDENNQ